MCGLAGFVGAGSRSDLEAMTAALAHRGPDGEGFHVEPGLRLHLGHRRLAVIDIAGGAQPMWDGAHEVGVVYNGEIYNFRELRRELEERGHRFATDHSDTEVLIHGYKEWGDGLPARLNGMFAFAIFDRPGKRLYLARDRFGEKPLYYFHRPGLFAFASELGALALHPRVSARIDRRAVVKLFAYGYIPAPLALYEGAAKLPAGGWLKFDMESGGLQAGTYWTFRIEPDEARRDTGALAEELRALLIQATRRRLVSDVPLGIFLSGGIDSSTILACAAQSVAPSQLSAFTVGFNEPSFDESAEARAVARHFGCRHAVEMLDLERARALLPEVLRRMDEPLGDPSILPTHLLCRHTRHSVTVALSGDGGDELFAGYDPFLALWPARLYNRLVPRGLHRGLRRLADLLPVASHNMSLDFRLRRTLSGLSHDTPMWNPVWMAPLEPGLLNDVLEQPISAEDVYSEAIDLWERPGDLGVIDRALEFFTHFYLSNGILAKTDRAAMMCSLEARAVFLDNDLVEFCRRLPSRFKFRGGQRKRLLKKAMAPLLPESVLRRAKKGFGMPLADWLRRLPAPPRTVPPGMNHGRLLSMWQAHCAGRADHRLALWCWLSMDAMIGSHAPQRAA
jgi:asparagine synthase (glutamine-hydrolysing)